LNVLASSIYLCATTLAYRFYVNYDVENADGVHLLQIIGDLLYLFDAYLYYECWRTDQYVYNVNNEQKEWIELRLRKQLTMDEMETSITATTCDH
jgi:hypothetical protein